MLIFADMLASNFTKQIAQRYIWSKRKEAFITIITIFAILGVALGVAVLDITMSIMTGFEKELKEKVVGQSHISIYRYSGKAINSETAIKNLEGIEEIDSVSPLIQSQVLLSAGKSSKGILIKAIPTYGHLARELKNYLPENANLDSLFNAPDPTSKIPGIIIGEELQNQLGVIPGSIVSIMTPQVSSTPFGLTPKFKRFMISSTYKSGLVGYEGSLAYTSMDNMKRFFKITGSTGIEVKVKDPDKVSKISKKIQKALGVEYFVRDWIQQNKQLWEALSLEKKVYFIVLLLLIVLASFSIVASLIMLVMEKRKDIAILKTLGASNSNIANIFRLHGAFIGLTGTVLGTLLGIFGCLALRTYGFPLPEKVFPTDTVPVYISYFNFLLVAVSAFFICLLATWYPANKASSLNPTEILRYE